MKKIIILTGSELRHEFFIKFISQDKNINVIGSYCEGVEKSLRAITDKSMGENLQRINHLIARENSEKDFFSVPLEIMNDFSIPTHIPNGDINKTELVNKIISINPDLIISYGCSIIKEPLLSKFEGRFINVHLGLSPYYRGSGTNFWPLVNGEPEYVGATFMYIDEGIDTGEVIHQIRATCFEGDTPSTIGNRLIIDMCRVLRKVIINFDSLEKNISTTKSINSKFYKKKDFTEASVAKLYNNFGNQLIKNYLQVAKKKNKKAPIFSNSTLNIFK